MSNISRRDFLKTAGVMTLAVAAAGVLAGCEGNNNTENNLPETGDKALGTVTKIGDFEFSVVKAVEQNNVRYTLNDGETETKKTVEAAFACVLVTVRNAGEKADAKFNFDKVKLYIDGQNVTSAVQTADPVKDQAKKLFGLDTVEQFPTSATAVAPSREAHNYWFFYQLPENAYKDGFKSANSLEVTYYDSKDKTAVNYKAETPLAVVELVKNKDYQ